MIRITRNINNYGRITIMGAYQIILYYDYDEGNGSLSNGDNSITNTISSTTIVLI